MLASNPAHDDGGGLVAVTLHTHKRPQLQRTMALPPLQRGWNLGLSRPWRRYQLVQLRLLS